jgi:hypothetical protein
MLVVDWKTICTSMDFLMLTNYKYILECREKVSPASAFWPVVSCISPASSAFRDQGRYPVIKDYSGIAQFWYFACTSDKYVPLWLFEGRD